MLIGRLQRGMRHLVEIVGAAVKGEQRQQMLALIHILKCSRAPLRESGLPGLMQFLDEQAAAHDLSAAQLLVRADAVAVFMPMQPYRHCMKRAILRYVILKSRGYVVSFRIGVERPDRSLLKGHAWVAINGVAFEEDDDQHQRMVTIYCYPSG